MNIGEQIRAIREAEGLTRKEFEEKTGMRLETLSGVERSTRMPSADKIKAICKAFPQYTLWLMADQINIDAGQISPDIKLRIDKDGEQSQKTA